MLFSIINEIRTYYDIFRNAILKSYPKGKNISLGNTGLRTSYSVTCFRVKCKSNLIILTVKI